MTESEAAARRPNLFFAGWAPWALALATAAGCLTPGRAAKVEAAAFVQGDVHAVAEAAVDARVDGVVTAEIAPSPRLKPLRPMLLPHRRAGGDARFIAVVEVDGLLLDSDAVGLGSWGENAVSLFRERLDAVERSPRVKGVLLRIHSPGGSVTATDVMRRDLRAFRQRTRLPVAACLMDVATGGAYYLATEADCISAHPTTVVGGIGCIFNAYNLQDMMGAFNIVGVPVKAGKNVDLGTPIAAMSEEGRACLQEMANEFHQKFRKGVVQMRPEVDAGDERLFDGRVFTASQALKAGLVDEIGYFDDAVERARAMAGEPSAELVFFRREADAPLSPYSTTPNTPLQDKLVPVNVPGLNRARLPSFLYLWEPDPTVEALHGK